MSAPVRLSAKARLRFDPWEGRYLLVYPERGLLLNDAAYSVLALCDGVRTAEELARLLAQRFAIGDESAVLEAVSGFLARLDGLGLLESDAQEESA